ncbi:MAG: hypothetical protein GTO24_22375 [candidate division Zixibacteria bacterium]|nr:hypothetical protein [candidate division Zixibacteria bacterium]
MKHSEHTTRYRFFGTEFRILLSLVALLLILSAGVAGFRRSYLLCTLLFLIFVLLVFFLRLDSKYHLVIVTPGKLIFENVVWRRLATSFVYVPWADVERVTTNPWGFFSLWKSTIIQSRRQKPVRVYSFMEDYVHFLRDVIKEAKSAEVDKLTLDLPAGRADL